MKRIYSFFKTKKAYLGLLLVALGFGGLMNGISPARSEDCSSIMTPPTDGAHFNIWPLSYAVKDCTDGPLIDAKNLTNTSGRDGRYAASQAEHDSGINAVAGDEIRVAVYVHNGSSATADRNVTTALNTRVGAGFSTEASKDHVISGSIAADNADAVYSTSKKASFPGQTQGGNITIHTPENTTLEFVPGKTQLYTKDRNMVPVPATDGIFNGDGFITNTVKVGNWLACFNYSGYVIYTVKVVGTTVTPPTPPQITIDKTVRNLARGGSPAFSKSVQARTGDVVDFKVIVTNPSPTLAQNVTVKDVLPAGLEFVKDSGQASLFTDTGYVIGDLPGKGEQTITFSATVKGGDGKYTNVAKVTAKDLPEQQSSADVIVSNPPVIPGVPGLAIEKNVRNVTKGTSFDPNSTTAQQGDTVEFQIKVSNTVASTTATNVILKDVLPSGLSMQPSNVSGITGDPNNLITSVGINLGDITSATPKTVTFQAKVNVNSGTLNNVATAKGSNTSEVSDNAQVVVSPIVIPPTGTTITIEKNVRNYTQNSSSNYVKSVSAQNGDQVDFQIVVKNTGSNIARDVIVKDTLPSGLDYIQGSGNPALFTSAGMGLNDIAVGGTATISFSARVNTCGATLINTASATSSNAPTPGSSQATVNANGGNGCGGGNTFPQLTITKYVKNLTFPGNTTDFNSHFVSAFQNDRVAFQVTVRSTGTQAVNNVVVKDILPSGLSFVNGTVRIDNGAANSVYDNFVGSGVNFGTMNPNDQHVIYFEANVNASAGASLQNVAQATGSNYGPVQDQATVSVGGVNGGNVNLVFKKTAVNTSANRGAGVAAVSCNNGTTDLCLNAAKEDYIVYTLTVQNTGNAPATNFTITDDLSNVLTYATLDTSSLTDGGVLNGKVISWNNVTIPAGQSVSRTFRVRVNFFLPQASNLTLTNTYGNQVIVKIIQPQVLGAVLVAPKTGAGATAGVVFAGLLTVAFAFMKRKGYINAFLNSVPKIKVQ